MDSIFKVWDYWQDLERNVYCVILEENGVLFFSEVALGEDDGQ